jgi:hypothetical protein
MTMSNRLGFYEYEGNGTLLDNDTRYTFFDTEDGVEAYADGSAEPVEMNRGTFTSLENGNLVEAEGGTPNR